MNGNHYVIANAPDYNSTYTSEFFDLYSHPIKTRYSEVYWTLQDPIPLPPDIVKRFENKVMAIVGYEVDQVKTLADGTDVSVPINHAYNHHYSAFLVNSRETQLVKKQVTPENKQQHAGLAHGRQEYWTVVDKEEDAATITSNNNKNDEKPFADIPRHHLFSEGNGGEFRKSYHGYPQGYGQLIYGPDVFHLTPMQIDTWNRDQGSSATFLPGAPLPQSAQDRASATIYSPLLECPCSDRIERVSNMAFALVNVTTAATSCPKKDEHEDNDVANATECWNGALSALTTDDKKEKKYIIVPPGNENASKAPRGCSLVEKEDTIYIYWNDNLHHVDDENNDNVVIPTKLVCRNGHVGTIAGHPFHESSRCAPFPKSVLRQQENPTCKIDTYLGGLLCCNHGQPLLDRDQDIPWPDQVLEYRLVFRFYFQEYATTRNVENNNKMTTKPPLTLRGGQETSRSSIVPFSHDNLIRLYWQTEANAAEYDILPCHDSHQDCIQIITSQWHVSDMVWDRRTLNNHDDVKIQLVYAAPHCHAPSCLSMELYNADTGQLICSVEPIYGHQHKNNNEEERFQEAGFLALPPCLWSLKTNNDNLPQPPMLSLNTKLLSIKRNNSTMHHTGEMAPWQMRGVIMTPTTAGSDESGYNDIA